jgi:hypothetical protein
VSTFGSRIFYSYGPSTPTTGDFETASATVAGFWHADLAPYTHEDYSLVEVTMTDLTSTDGATGSWHGSNPGLSAGGAVPSNVTMDLDLSIASRYRGGHPVLHHPAPQSANLATPRTWNSSILTDFNTGAGDFLSDLNTTSLIGDVDGTWVVLRGYRPGALPEAVTIWPVLSIQPRQYVGTMRRRARSLR